MASKLKRRNRKWLKLTAIIGVSLILLSLGIYRLPSWIRPELEGQWIAFSCGGRIYLMREDGSGRHPLLPPNYRHIGGPTWSPDGEWIAFTHHLRPNYYDRSIIIEAVRTNGEDVYPITGSVREENLNPEWSPDGEWILFYSLRPGISRHEIFRVQPDGSQLEQLTHRERVFEAYWSPDADRIIYRLGNNSLYFMNIDDHKHELLLEEKDSATNLAWSPDGEWIAFVSRNASKGFDLTLIRVDGSERHDIVNFRLLGGLDWSPDGTRIAFWGLREDGAEEGFQIWSIRPDGTDLQQMTDMKRCQPSSPAWSPILTTN